MDGEFSRILKLHELAAKFGDGLKPELYELLLANRKDWPDSVASINAPLHSSGPAHHTLSPEELANRGVTQLTSCRSAQTQIRKHDR